jgi:hypothetical protein
VTLPEALVFYNHENKIEKTILVSQHIEIQSLEKLSEV